MRHADLDELKSLVGAAIRSLSPEDSLRHVDVDPVGSDDEDGFLRIVAHFKDLGALSEGDVDTIVSRVEDEVAKRDDRFPSVRFSGP